ncbi:RluA family pseudouridine synthase [uncultured Kriegella sp.]|uniref:RluA family pseudouridine synthase n=1 Tax=uncultured Kriegella sp. TaxID=1798910 RepID=UPI0030D7FDF7
MIASTEIHIVPQLATPVRLQEYGVGIFNRALTKSALKKVLKKKYVTVNGVTATTATFIKGGETIQLTIQAAVSMGKRPILRLNVLFEDEHLAIVYKPAGILVSGNGFMTIAHVLPQNLKPSPLSDATAPQPVHRLDYATTGLLLVGKTSSSIRDLNRLFANKNVKKTYYAITIGEMNATGEISATIDDKSSLSKYAVKATVPSKRFGKLNLVRLNPKTGRRHQLRKHLSGIGNPILGDRDYGDKDLILKGKGLYLHAYALKFVHPVTLESHHVVTEFPQRFKKIFEQL